MELSQRAIKELIKHFTGQSQMLTIPRPFIRLTGDHECALMLNQIIYWSERTDDAEGWFYKTHDQWAEELELSPAQVRRIVKRLEKVGVESKVRKHNGAPKLHFRVNEEIFHHELLAFLEHEKPHPIINNFDNQQSVLSKLPDPIINNLDNQQSSLSDNELSSLSDNEDSSLSSKDTKITAKTTSKITSLPQASLSEAADAHAPPAAPAKNKSSTKAVSAAARLPAAERAVLEAWRETTKRYPLEAVWSYILSRIKTDFDPERLKRCGGAYLANFGLGHKHVAGICDWYTENRTEPRGNENAESASNNRKFGQKPPVARDYSHYGSGGSG